MVNQLSVTEYYKGAGRIEDAAVNKSGIMNMFLGKKYSVVAYRQIEGSGMDDFCKRIRNRIYHSYYYLSVYIYCNSRRFNGYLQRNFEENAEKLAMPLKQIIERLERLSEGDLTSVADLSTTTTEMIEMNRAMKTAVNNLNNIIVNIKEKLLQLSNGDFRYDMDKERDIYVGDFEAW